MDATVAAHLQVPADLVDGTGAYRMALFGLTVVLAGVQTWLFLGRSVVRDEPSGWPVLTLGLVLWAALGAVIIVRYPRHRVGWLFIAGGLLAVLGTCLSGYSDITASGPTPDSPAIWSWAVWLALFLDGRCRCCSSSCSPPGETPRAAVEAVPGPYRRRGHRMTLSPTVFRRRR